jgi:hypothetical protein
VAVRRTQAAAVLEQPGLFEMGSRQVEAGDTGPPYYWCLLTEAEVEELARGTVPVTLQTYARECVMTLAEWVTRPR